MQPRSFLIIFILKDTQIYQIEVTVTVAAFDRTCRAQNIPLIVLRVVF